VIEERDKSMPWKIKGIAAKTTYRLFSKFGNPSYVDDKFAEFSERFKTTFAIPMLESHLAQLFQRKTSFIGSKTLNFAIKYVQQAAKLPLTMQVLYPFIEQILFENIVPIMQPSHADVTLFKEDPIEYIRKQNDFTDSLFSPKNSIVDLLIRLCTYKTNKKAKKPDFLHKFLEFCVTNLTQYSQQAATQ
jgi:importin-7